MAKKVFIDAGHGGADSGAVKYVKESEVNISVVNYMAAYLEYSYDCAVKKDITADSINTVVGRANSWGADLFISIHFNAGGGDGFESLVYGASNKNLGQCFANHAKEAGQNLRNPAVKCRPDLGVLRLTKMPAVLNEIAFVDNKTDIKDWDEAHELKKIGIALAEAAAEWLDLPAKGTKYKALMDLNFRKTPDLDGAVIGTVKKGTVLVGTVDKNGWLKTIHGGKAGYVRQKGQKVYMTKL